MKSANSRILTINGGSSSIKFALFEANEPIRRFLEGGIERIGLPESSLLRRRCDLPGRGAGPVAELIVRETRR
jgi:hypothetical protein